MLETIFKHQPGLISRCLWVFEIAEYSPKELRQIFERQASKDSWKLDVPNLDSFFKEEHSNLPGFGRDTEKLLLFSKIECAKESFKNKELYAWTLSSM